MENIFSSRILQGLLRMRILHSSSQIKSKRTHSLYTAGKENINHTGTPPQFDVVGKAFLSSIDCTITCDDGNTGVCQSNCLGPSGHLLTMLGKRQCLAGNHFLISGLYCRLYFPIPSLLFIALSIQICLHPLCTLIK